MNRTFSASATLLSRGALRLCKPNAPHHLGASAPPTALAAAVTTTKPLLAYSSSDHPIITTSRCHYAANATIKVRSYFEYMKRKIKPPPSPPYSCHVCQVGDPVLRAKAEAVDPEAITGAEVQLVIKNMVRVMRKLDCVGLSAPQVGVPLRILALEYTKKMLEEICIISPALREASGVSIQPLRIFVNPKLRVLDGRKVVFQEACQSLAGFSAAVPRYLSVEVSGLNEKGEAVTWQASGWPARILQHEMDHLDGVLYIDHMDSTTFININWDLDN